MCGERENALRRLAGVTTAATEAALLLPAGRTELLTTGVAAFAGSIAPVPTTTGGAAATVGVARESRDMSTTAGPVSVEDIAEAGTVAAEAGAEAEAAEAGTASDDDA